VTEFRLATAADEELLRSLMRENGMPTWVEMAIEREPSSFDGQVFGREWAVIAEEDRAVVGMYTAAVLPVHVNGRPEQLGYLGGMRLSAPHRHRFRHVRAGYASIRRLAPLGGTLPWWFTVVASENTAARRLLESGVPGLPGYHTVGDICTFGLPTARGQEGDAWRAAAEADVPRLVEFHNDRAVRLQFAPVLREATVRRIGVERFLLHERAGELRGVVALWDQRAFKRIVARRYRRPVGALIPAYNAYARVFRRMPLPRPGKALDQTFLAFLALDVGALENGRALLRELLARCTTRVASLGMHAAHPLVSVLEELAPMRYPARVYAVSFEGRPDVADLPAQPEVALL
jgi:hypothetical protein